MSDLMQGVIHGRTIKLEQDPGLGDGRHVEVTVRVKESPEAPADHAARRETAAGMLADLPPRVDEDLEEILRGRKCNVAHSRECTQKQ